MVEIGETAGRHRIKHRLHIVRIVNAFQIGPFSKRRIATVKQREGLVLKRLKHRTKALRSFGVIRTRVVVAAIGMREQNGMHGGFQAAAAPFRMLNLWPPSIVSISKNV